MDLKPALSVLTVSGLNALVRELVEDNFLDLLVEGEISNVSFPASGHLYFCLKDDAAQIRAVIFRPQARLLRFRPEDGMHVVCRGRISFYSQRGEIQLVAEDLQPMGIGSLQVAFEQLKGKLSAEGLFDLHRKRPLPGFPRTVGIVTSPTGAAIRDILHVLRRRGSGVRVLIRPVRVQGEGSAAEIAEAIADLNRQGEADVIIVGRGGGSLEDLWAFNEEATARAIYKSEIPVIAAVGHETDVTIADFVADLRAPTPSAAAELVAKSRHEVENHLRHLEQRLMSRMQGRLDLARIAVTSLGRRLRSPRQEVDLFRQRTVDLEKRLEREMYLSLREAEGRLAVLTGRLDSLSPLQTLARGYSIAFSDRTGRAVRDAAELERGDRLRIRLFRGSVRAAVEEVEK